MLAQHAAQLVEHSGAIGQIVFARDGDGAAQEDAARSRRASRRARRDRRIGLRQQRGDLPAQARARLLLALLVDVAAIGQHDEGGVCGEEAREVAKQTSASAAPGLPATRGARPASMATSHRNTARAAPRRSAPWWKELIERADRRAGARRDSVMVAAS